MNVSQYKVLLIILFFFEPIFSMLEADRVSQQQMRINNVLKLQFSCNNVDLVNAFHPQEELSQ